MLIYNNLYPEYIILIFLIAVLMSASVTVSLSLLTKRVIREVAKIDPILGETVLSAVELSHDWKKMSQKEDWKTIVKEFFENAAKSVEEKGKVVKISILPPVPAFLILGFSALISAGIFLKQTWMGDRYEVVKKINAEITPPSYTLLSPYILQNEYEIKDVIAGSSISVRFETDSKIEMVKIKDEFSEKHPEKTGNIFSFSFQVTHDTSINFFGKMGVKWFENFESMQVSVKKDKEPEVQILSPEGEVLLRDEKRVMVSYDVKDDFGLTRLRFAFQKEGGSVQYLDLSMKEGETHIIGNYVWDLSWLEAGERIYGWIEALDNDAISGPKLGRSRTFTVEMFSLKKVLLSLLDRFDHLLGMMVDILALQIEQVIEGKKPFSKEAMRKVDEKENEVFNEFESIFSSVREELKVQGGEIGKIMSAYENFHSAVKERRKNEEDLKLLQQKFIKEVESTEQLILLLDRTWRDELLSFAQDEINKLLKKREELISRLEKGENVDEILRQLTKVNEMLRNIMNKLAQKLAEMPDDYLNPVDVERIRAGSEGERIFEELKRAVEEKNFQKAKELLNQYLNNLQELAGSMKNISGEMAMGGMEAFKTFSEVAKEINEIKEAEKKLKNEHLSRLSGGNEKLKQEVDEAENILKEYIEKARKHYRESVQRNAFPLRFPFIESRMNEVERGFNQMEMHVDEGNYEELMRESEMVKENLKALRDVAVGRENKENLETSKEYVEKIMEMIKKLSNLKISAGECNRLGEDQDSISRRLSSLRRKADELGSKNLMEKIERSLNSMEEARDKIEGNRNAEAIKKEKNAIGYLEEAQEELDKMINQMEGKRLLSLFPSEEGEILGSEVERGKVAIPEEEKYEAKEKLRRQIEEALKKGLPEEKKTYNKKYYNELIQ
uniref:DUF4175 domain-containing protein n=1 Tax=uncultured prokaryote TaxID=198431 RepID=H5SPY2_9ZZZZ|nr:hypothetical protein HGMM_F55D02C18 [uncultured prokaryote]